MRQNRRENSSTPRLIIIIIIDIFTRFLRYSSTTPCSFLPTICVVVVVLGCLGFFFFVSSSSSSSSSLRFFFDKKEPTFLFSLFDTTRTKTRGDANRRWYHRHGHNDRRRRRRRDNKSAPKKSDRRRGVDWVFERASVRVGIGIRSIVGKSAISAPLSDDAKPVVVVLEGVFFENEPRRGGGERRVEQSGNGRVPVVSSVLVRGPEICKVHFVPTLFVLLKAVARPILSPGDAKPETRGRGAHGTVSVLGERRDGKSEGDTGVQRRGESAAGCLKCQTTFTTFTTTRGERTLIEYYIPNTL